MERESEWQHECRGYLELLGKARVGPDTQGNLDLSGVIEETLLAATAEGETIRERPESERIAWLTNAFQHHLSELLRRSGMRASDDPESPTLDATLDESASRVHEWMHGSFFTDGEQLEHNRNVQELLLAIVRLPEQQRQAIEMHSMEDRALGDVAERMNLSEGDVAGLLHEGMSRLRELGVLNVFGKN
ncbi:MAG: RNA polymerase sigma factor [Rubripirellula sp.]